MNYSQHFQESEFTYSATANKYKQSNLPTPEHKKNLITLCNKVLEPLRELIINSYKEYNNKKVKSVAINITSGYRSETVNKLLEKEGYHPSRTSQHCKGQAADIQVVLIFTDNTKFNLPFSETYKFIKNLVKNKKLIVDQLIQEKQGSMTWVHISYREGNNRNQFLIFDGKGYRDDK